jgi:hypothetical protein
MKIYALWIEYEYEIHAPVFFGETLTDIFDWIRDTKRSLECDEVTILEHELNKDNYGDEDTIICKKEHTWQLTNKQIREELKRDYNDTCNK